MIQPQDCWVSEPEVMFFQVNLQGQGAGNAPTRLKGRNNYTITRTGTGVLKISFQDDPGPTFMGCDGGGFGDATASNVAGWTLVEGGYTPRSGNTSAFVTVTMCNSTFAAADLLATSRLSISFCFKQAFTDL